MDSELPELESKLEASSGERFYCPYPGCNRSFAELWRLKVHFRAPPDIRGSGKERGHGTELTHCPKCNKQLKPGKHHVGCSGTKAAPRQAVKRSRMGSDTGSGGLDEGDGTTGTPRRRSGGANEQDGPMTYKQEYVGPQGFLQPIGPMHSGDPSSSQQQGVWPTQPAPHAMFYPPPGAQPYWPDPNSPNVHLMNGYIGQPMQPYPPQYLAQPMYTAQHPGMQAPLAAVGMPPQYQAYAGLMAGQLQHPQPYLQAAQGSPIGQPLLMQPGAPGMPPGMQQPGLQPMPSLQHLQPGSALQMQQPIQQQQLAAHHSPPPPPHLQPLMPQPAPPPQQHLQASQQAPQQLHPVHPHMQALQGHPQAHPQLSSASLPSQDHLQPPQVHPQQLPTPAQPSHAPSLPIQQQLAPQQPIPLPPSNQSTSATTAPAPDTSVTGRLSASQAPDGLTQECLFDLEELAKDFGRIPSPPPLPPDFHAASGGPTMLFNFAQFSQRLSSNTSRTALDRELAAAGLEVPDPGLLYDHTDDGDIMQLLFGVPDDVPTMATIHLHQHRLGDEDDNVSLGGSSLMNNYSQQPASSSGRTFAEQVIQQPSTAQSPLQATQPSAVKTEQGQQLLPAQAPVPAASQGLLTAQVLPSGLREQPQATLLPLIKADSSPAESSLERAANGVTGFGSALHGHQTDSGNRNMLSLGKEYRGLLPAHVAVPNTSGAQSAYGQVHASGCGRTEEPSGDGHHMSLGLSVPLHDDHHQRDGLFDAETFRLLQSCD